VLPKDAVEATLRAAHRFVERVSRKRRPRVVAVATAAVREAKNRDVLVRSLKSQDGVALEVLSGSEEARLGAEAAVRSRSLTSGVVVDLGGGSVQITAVRDGRVGDGTSLPLGAVRLTHRFLEHDPPTPAELAELRKEIRAAAAPSLPGYRNGDRFVVLGGTARALARFCAEKPERRAKTASASTVVERAELAAARLELQKLTSSERRKAAGLKAERADVVVAGAMVLEELMNIGGFPEFVASAASVREGVLFREAARLSR
jgi:exopolyphosphatase/guanosine-5'-triphosphate,3'-diphosphate pyrophosphatase